MHHLTRQGPHSGHPSSKLTCTGCDVPHTPEQAVMPSQYQKQNPNSVAHHPSFHLYSLLPLVCAWYTALPKSCGSSRSCVHRTIAVAGSPALLSRAKFTSITARCAPRSPHGICVGLPLDAVPGQLSCPTSADVTMSLSGRSAAMRRRIRMTICPVCNAHLSRCCAKTLRGRAAQLSDAKGL